MRVRRHASGSVRYDKRRKTWNYLWYDGATRRSKLIGTKQEFPTKAAVWKEVERLKVRPTKTKNTIGSTVREVIARYEPERMPSLSSLSSKAVMFLPCKHYDYRPKRGRQEGPKTRSDSALCAQPSKSTAQY